MIRVPPHPRPDLRVVLVTDGAGDPDRIVRVASAARDGGLATVQVRERSLPDRRFVSLLLALRSIFPRGEGTVLVNDRLDLALAGGADGVHLGFRSCAAAEARGILGAAARIGVSCHGPDETGAADGADFVVFGPVFRTPSKQGRLEPRGTDGLERAVRAFPIPVVAIGGIGVDEARACARAGAAGVACVRAFFGTDDPAGVARAIRRAFEEGAP